MQKSSKLRIGTWANVSKLNPSDNLHEYLLTRNWHAISLDLKKKLYWIFSKSSSLLLPVFLSTAMTLSL
jgi:hypothetical protein